MIRNHNHRFLESASDTIRTIKQLNQFLQELVDDENLDVTNNNGAAGIHNPDYGVMSMTIKANKQNPKQNLKCLVPDIDDIDWSDYINQVVKHAKKWNITADDEEESILNAMLEVLTDYYLFNCGDDTVEINSFSLPISKDELLDIITLDLEHEERDLEHYVVDNFYDDVLQQLDTTSDDMDESSQRRHHKHHITEKRTQLYRKSENKNKKQKNYKLENILIPEKRSFRRKDLNDRLMLGSIMHPDYQTALSNGKYFYATKEDIFDFIADTGLQTIYTAKLPKNAADNMFRYTSDGRSNPIRLNKLDITINGNKFDVTDNDGETLTGDTKDLKTLKSLFVNTPKNIQTFFVPYQHMFFLCLQADGEFGVMMVEYK